LSAQASELERLLERGQAAAQAGKKAEARYFFQAVLKLAPHQPDALLWLAYLAGGGRASMVYLARLLQATPHDPRAQAAVLWARERAQPQTALAPSAQAPSAQAPGSSWRSHRTLVGLLALLLVSLMSVAFTRGALSLPLPTATQARLTTPLPVPSAAPTALPSPTTPPSPTSRLPLLTPWAEPVQPTAQAAGSSQAFVTLTSIAGERHTHQIPTPTSPLTQTVTPTPSLPTAFPTMSIGDSFRWIDVDLSEQRLIAYQGNEPARSVLVSTGLWRTPTVVGRFQIYVKYKSARMSGPGYNLPNVPHIMYFYRDYALHGAYWHTNFGRPMSHGCVNLPLSDAEWLYDWASVGTLVVVHE
jgi:lipoprotein-anchoring transpeptidase ErfK/SrfK